MQSKLTPVKLFKYKAKLGDIGKTTRGKIGSISGQKAMKTLERNGYYDIELKEIKQAMVPKKIKVKDKEIADLFTFISNQLESGTQLARALDLAMENNFKYPTLRFINSIREKLEEGASFTDSVDYAKVLPPDIIRLIEIGEETGKIIDSLREIAKLYLSQYTIKKDIRKSMYQPVGLLVFAFSIMLFLVPVLLKPIESLQSQFDAGGLPVITVIVVNITNWISHYWILLIVFIVFIIYGQRYLYNNNEKFRFKWDQIMWNLPLIGKFKQALGSYLFVLNMSILVKSGTEMSKAIHLIVESTKNLEFKRDLEGIYNYLRKGNSMEDSIMRSAYLPFSIKDRIKEGSETGQLSNRLNELRIFAEKEFQEKSKLITAAISKTIALIVTILIAIIIIAGYMPMFSMVGKIMNTLK